MLVQAKDFNNLKVNELQAAIFRYIVILPLAQC